MNDEIKAKIALAAAGVKSLEHGNFISDEALDASIELHEIILEYLEAIGQRGFFISALIQHKYGLTQIKWYRDCHKREMESRERDRQKNAETTSND